MKKLLIIAFFATVLNSSAHLPDSLYNILDSALFTGHYIKMQIEGKQGNYMFAPNYEGPYDTVYYVSHLGKQTIFFYVDTNNRIYQIPVIIENRYGILRSDESTIIKTEDGKIIRYKSYKTRKTECD